MLLVLVFGVDFGAGERAGGEASGSCFFVLLEIKKNVRWFACTHTFQHLMHHPWAWING